MAGIAAFFASICQFFALLCASVMSVFVSKQSAEVEVVNDLESGLSPSSVAKADLAVDANVIHVQKDVQSPVPEETEDNSSPVTRRPSRPASMVHPVKSRIVEATFKQVQDKTLNVVKTVVITPCSVVPIACSAVVEYYDPRKDAVLVTTTTKIAEPERSVQFVHSPTVIDDDKYEAESSESFVRDSESISDLLDLFPAPPKHLPPSPAPTCGLPLAPTSQVRILVEGTARRTSRTVKIRPALILTQSSPYNSDAESTRSVQSLSSDTQDLVELSHNGTPKFLSPDTAYFVDALMDPRAADVEICDLEDDDVIRELEEYAAEEAADAALRLAHAQILSNGRFAVVTSPSSPNLSALARLSEEDSDISRHDLESSNDSYELQDSLETASTYASKASDTLTSQDSDRSDLFVDANSLSSHDALSCFKDTTLSDCSPALLPKSLVTPYHNVVDGAANADRHKGDIVDRAFWIQTGAADALAQADTILRELLRTSPSEDEIVDCLLAQLEQSFEYDSEDDEQQWARRRESLAWVEGQTTLTDGVKARLHKHLSLCSGSKNKSMRLAAAVKKDEESRQTARASWEESMEKVLQMFRDIEAEDEDFRDMFYNDTSSVWSQSSFHRSLPDLKEDSGSSLDSSQDKTSSEDSFAMADRFSYLDSGDISGVFELNPPRSTQVVADTEAQAVLALSELGIVVKNVGLPSKRQTKVDVMETALVPPHDSGYESSGGDGLDDCTTRCSWVATGARTEDEGGGIGDNEEDEDEESEGETDQWSDVLTLDEYIAP